MSTVGVSRVAVTRRLRDTHLPDAQPARSALPLHRREESALVVGGEAAAHLQHEPVAHRVRRLARDGAVEDIDADGEGDARELLGLNAARFQQRSELTNFPFERLNRRRSLSVRPTANC